MKLILFAASDFFREYVPYDFGGCGRATIVSDESPREEFVHYTSRGELEGLRQGNWKLLVKKPRPNRNKNKKKAMIFIKLIRRRYK